MVKPETYSFQLSIISPVSLEAARCDTRGKIPIVQGEMSTLEQQQFFTDFLSDIYCKTARASFSGLFFPTKSCMLPDRHLSSQKNILCLTAWSYDPDTRIFLQSVSDAQRLRPLSPGASAAWPRKILSVLCGICAKRIFHTTHSIRRAPQARASGRDGKQTTLKRLLRNQSLRLEEKRRLTKLWPLIIIRVPSGATSPTVRTDDADQAPTSV